MNVHAQQPLVRKEVLLACLDLLAFAASVAGALELRFLGDIPWEHELPYLYFWPVLFAWRLAIAYRFGCYDFRHRLTLTDHVFGGCGAALAGILPGYLFVALLQLYGLPLTRISRAAVALDAVFVALWFALSRGAALAWLERRGYAVRVLLLGPLVSCRELAREIREFAPRLLKLDGIAASDPVTPPVHPPVNGGTEGGHPEDDVLGSAQEVAALLSRHGIDQVILTNIELPQAELGDLLAQCDARHVETFSYPRLDLSIFVHGRIHSIAGLPLVPLVPANATGLYRAGKRLLDVVAALVLSVALLPACLVAAVAVKLTSPGPILFRQERVGREGRSFRIWKFRTMAAGAEHTSGPTVSAAGDPRITPVGRFLRKWRLDEIPQLWNVLRGDMSLVGPRPERSAFVAGFRRENPLYERRFLVRPGLSGLAQIHGRYDSDYTHKLRYDLIYINSVSFSLDLRILLATIQTVLTGHGAR